MPAAVPLNTTLSIAPCATKVTVGPLKLRIFQPQDLNPLYDAVFESRAELSAWMPWCHANYSRDDTRCWLANRAEVWTADEDYSLAIVDAQSGRILGGTGLNFIDRTYRRANLGYWVRSSELGRGIATIVTRRTARWGLETLEFERIEIVIAVANERSLRVAERAGAVEEGTLRKRISHYDQQWDAKIYSFTREDLPRLQD